MQKINDKLKKLAASWATYKGSKNGKYFTTSKKGENFELKIELNSDRPERKKEAIKKVIANMTVGKDVGVLFADVLKCMQTDDIELKKLVYLYLMNYATCQPDLVILAINTFCKDTEHPNPLIRALAIRTMGCIRVDKMTDYLCMPLKKALMDPSPYVRKTAAITVTKLYDLSPTLAEEHGFINKLQELVSDLNPSVVANAVAALSEIHERSPERNVFTLNSIHLSRLLSSLNECNEWGQLAIMEAVSSYKASNEGEAEMIIDKILPRLQHANPAVIVTAVRLLLLFGDTIQENVRLKEQILKKMASSIITILSCSYAEVQYVILRNIKLIIQKHPHFLRKDLKVLFCKYNDALYVKLEKLDLMVSLANEDNIDEILAELQECTKEIEVAFLTKAIKSIGQCAFAVTSSASKCTHILVDILSLHAMPTTSPCIVVLKDMLQEYGIKLPIRMPVLFEQFELITDPDAKASLIWILGEYCHLLENAPNLLSYFAESFMEEPTQVQYQLLTAAVKIYVRMPSFVQKTVLALLEKTTQNCENADLRDKAFVYWRLLTSGDPKLAKSVVFMNKNILGHDHGENLDLFSPETLQKLLKEISTISSVYHIPPEEMKLPEVHPPSLIGNDSDFSSPFTMLEALPDGTKIENILDLDFDDASMLPHDMGATSRSSHHQSVSVLDLLSDDAAFDDKQSVHSMMTTYGQGIGYSLSPLASTIITQTSHCYAVEAPLECLLSVTAGQGLEIFGRIARLKNELIFEMVFHNKSGQSMKDLAVQFNKNSFGITLAKPPTLSPKLLPGSTHKENLLLDQSLEMMEWMEPLMLLQIAVKNHIDIYYFDYYVPISSLLRRSSTATTSGKYDVVFDKSWAAMEPSEEYELKLSEEGPGALMKDDFQLMERLNKRHIECVSKQNNVMKTVTKILPNIDILAQLIFVSPFGNFDSSTETPSSAAAVPSVVDRILMRSNLPEILPHFGNTLINILKN